MVALMEAIVETRQDGEEDRAVSSSIRQPVKLSRNPLCNHQQQILTLDEWETAIHVSLSERPDEIIDIFERYAAREEQLQEALSSSLREQLRGEWQEQHTVDETREADEGRDDGRSDVWSNSRESIEAGLVQELCHKLTQLSYTSSSLMPLRNEGETNTHTRTVPQRMENVACMKMLQDDLAAERHKSATLARHLEETYRIHEEKQEEMWQRVQYLEHQLQQATEDAPTVDTQPEEPSRMAHTQTHAADYTLKTQDGDFNTRKEMEHKVSVLSKALNDLQRENTQLKGASNQPAADQDKQIDCVDAHHCKELELELEERRKDLEEMRCREEKLQALILRSERVVEHQKRKLGKTQQSLHWTVKLYEYEKSARQTLERINDTTQTVLDKLHRKVEERRQVIDHLRALLECQSERNQPILINFEEQNAKNQNMSSVVI